MPVCHQEWAGWSFLGACGDSSPRGCELWYRRVCCFHLFAFAANMLQLRSPFPKLRYTFRKASGQMSILMFVSCDQGQGFGRKMGAQQMFGPGMPPALLLFDPLHDPFGDPPSFFSHWMLWHKFLDVRRGFLWTKALWKGSPSAQLVHEFPSSPQLWWQQPVSPRYFLASVPSQ